MNTAQTEQSCAERVETHAADRLNDIRELLDPRPQDLALEHIGGGTWNLLIADREAVSLEEGEIIEYNEAATENEPMKALMFEDFEDDIREAAREAWGEYGLAFDYIAGGTYPDQEEGFFCYLISTGGPGEEIRFFASPGPRGWSLYRIEFWLLDWFDGACLDITNEPAARLAWDDLDECEAIEGAFKFAIED